MKPPNTILLTEMGNLRPPVKFPTRQPCWKRNPSRQMFNIVLLVKQIIEEKRNKKDNKSQLEWKRWNRMKQHSFYTKNRQGRAKTTATSSHLVIENEYIFRVSVLHRTALLQQFPRVKHCLCARERWFYDGSIAVKSWLAWITWE